MSGRDLVEHMVAAIQRRDADGYAAVFAEDAVLEHPLTPEPLQGRAVIREGEQALFDAFSDIEVDVRSVTGDDSRVVVEVLLRATNTGPIDLGEGEPIQATARRIEVPAVWILEVSADGVVTAERDYFDTAVMMSQLGIS